jgi:large subunit ribosomal protein L4
MFSVNVKSSEGKDIGTIKLDESIFNDKILPSSVYQVINAYRSNQRKGLAATKTRGEVSGGGKKPWKQKGTGRARVGSIRSPRWRHGGVVFGPHPRDFSFDVPKKMKDQALKFALSEKARTNDLIVVEAISFTAPKTKEGAKLLKNLNAADVRNVLVLVEKSEAVVKRVFGNIANVRLDLAKDVNTYEVLEARKVIVTKAGLTELTGRLKSGSN